MFARRPHMPYQTPPSLVRVLREIGTKKPVIELLENIDTLETTVPHHRDDIPFLTFIGQETKDPQEKMTLEIVNPYEATPDLIEAGIRRFYEKYGNYPNQIFLNAFRHFTYGMIVKEHMLPLPIALRIPCLYSGNPDCDIILKKEESL